MQYISSDTNVWIDFFSIDRLELPFRLPFRYIMYEETIDNELIKPPDMGQRLQALGLESVDITLEEYILAEQLNEQYKHPSNHDCVALAIAKVRGLVLLTGDGPLRKAAEKENVKVIGTIGILDKLMERGTITTEEYRECLVKLDALNGGVVRLPRKAIKERLDK